MLGDVARKLIFTAAGTAIVAASQPRMLLQIKPAEQRLDPQQPSYMISFYDLRQNQELEQIERHFEVTDSHVQDTNRDLVLLEREISDMQGANRVWFWLLAGLITAIGVATFRTGAISIGKGKRND